MRPHQWGRIEKGIRNKGNDPEGSDRPPTSSPPSPSRAALRKQHEPPTHPRGSLLHLPPRPALGQRTPPLLQPPMHRPQRGGGMSRDYYGPDPAGTGSILSVEDDVWVLIHPGGRVEWIGDAQDRAELR